jgi:hypothetical protein
VDFDTAFERLIGHEGGLVEHPADPGGLTKYGISQRSYPGEDIRGMTLARAKEIYRRDYWGPSGCDAVPDSIKFLMFDCGVNSGPEAAIRLLQRSVGTTEDAELGSLGQRRDHVKPWCRRGEHYGQRARTRDGDGSLRDHVPRQGALPPNHRIWLGQQRLPPNRGDHLQLEREDRRSDGDDHGPRREQRCTHLDHPGPDWDDLPIGLELRCRLVVRTGAVDPQDSYHGAACGWAWGVHVS